MLGSEPKLVSHVKRIDEDAVVGNCMTSERSHNIEDGQSSLELTVKRDVFTKLDMSNKDDVLDGSWQFISAGARLKSLTFDKIEEKTRKKTKRKPTKTSSLTK